MKKNTQIKHKLSIPTEIYSFHISRDRITGIHHGRGKLLLTLSFYNEYICNNRGPKTDTFHIGTWIWVVEMEFIGISTTSSNYCLKWSINDQREATTLSEGEEETISVLSIFGPNGIQIERKRRMEFVSVAEWKLRLLVMQKSKRSRAKFILLLVVIKKIIMIKK